MNLRKLITIILSAIIFNFALVNSDSDGELEDFDFINPSDAKNHDYFEEPAEKRDKLDDFFDSKDTFETGQFHNPFDLKEKVIRTALAKALTNKVLRQKFVEVMPILRVLSSHQKLALSALISAQISAKPGTELKLDQVKSMFGDSKKLIIPLVFDIANLVKTAAKNSLHYFYNFHSQNPQRIEIAASRRNFEVGQTEEEEVLVLSKENIDPMTINDQLYRLRNSRKLGIFHNSHDELNHSRAKRAAICPHGCPLSNRTHDSTLRLKSHQQPSIFPVIEKRSFNEGKLNTTNFISPYDKNNASPEDRKILGASNVQDIPKVSYEDLENSAFSDMNETSYNNVRINGTFDDIPEELPVPESLTGPRQRASNNVAGSRASEGRRTRPKSSLSKKCEKFTASMCLKADDYPTELIMGSIRRHKQAMSALLAEYRDKAAELELEEYQEEYELSQQRREDGANEVMPGGMCQSVVRYARPQKARSASGEWKYIVNTGQHTQTLRLEKCSHPQASCSYLSENYRSRCIQVYNYHRLLSWDKMRGLHVEIFKVPICCACHVDGYREAYPPTLGANSEKIKEYAVIKGVKPHPYTTFDEEEYEEDLDEGDDSIAYQYGNGFKKVKPYKYDPSELLSSSATIKNRFEGTKKQKYSPTFGSHVNPPAGAFDQQYNFKRGPNLSPSIGGYLNNLNRFRRPQQGGYESDDRADQESAGSELGKEVTVYPTIDKTTIRPNRKRVSSVSTATPKPASISSFPSTSGAKNFHTSKVSSTKSDMNKRINYNYHPIIDFFEEHSVPGAAASSISQKTKAKWTQFY